MPARFSAQMTASATVRFDQLTAARMERQKILTNDHPPQLVAVLDEGTLRRTGDSNEALSRNPSVDLLKEVETYHGPQ